MDNNLVTARLLEEAGPGIACLTRPGQAVCLLRTPEGAVIASVPWTEERQWEQVFRQLIDSRANLGVLSGPEGGLHLVLVGGPSEESGHARAMEPTLNDPMVHTWQIDDAGQLHVGGPGKRGSVAGRALARVEAEPDAPVDAGEVERALSQARRRAASEQGEVAGWFAALQARPVPITKLIIGVCVAGFVLETALGATDSIGRLIALGATDPRGHDPLRWFSYASLHGGVIHLLMNMSVLWNLGPLLERLVGGRRFLALYTFSALGGGIAIQEVAGSVGVGASGAIWGLMVAAGWIALRRADLMPRPVSASLRQGTLKSLGINLLISLLPGISLAGHLGGALGGLIFTWALLTRGLERGADDAEPPALDDGPEWTALAVASAVALFGSFAIRILLGGAWGLSA